jgi:hypothetical protein
MPPTIRLIAAIAVIRRVKFAEDSCLAWISVVGSRVTKSSSSGEGLDRLPLGEVDAGQGPPDACPERLDILLDQGEGGVDRLREGGPGRPGGGQRLARWLLVAAGEHHPGARSCRHQDDHDHAVQHWFSERR